jgi:hypothetical protein
MMIKRRLRSLEELLSINENLKEKDGIVVESTEFISSITLDTEGDVEMYAESYARKGEPVSEYPIRFHVGRRPHIHHKRKFHFRKINYRKAVFLTNKKDYDREKRQGLYDGPFREYTPTKEQKEKWNEIIENILSK